MSFEPPPADEATSEREECFVHLATAVGTQEQLAVTDGNPSGPFCNIKQD
jgi:hypothetical protein